MSVYIPIPDPITPAWLTTLIREAGVLQQGNVIAFETKLNGAFNSHILHLSILYSPDAPPEAPKDLILKRNIPEDWGIEAGAEEVKFYTFIATLPDLPPVIVPCYAAAYDPKSGSSYLLLLDVSQTHHQPITRDQQIGIIEGIPAEVDIESTVDALARLHAYFWDHPRLKAGVFDIGYWSRNEERFTAYLQRRKLSWDSLIAQEATWLPDSIRETYEQLFLFLPQYWERYLKPRFQSEKDLTLLHGDSYFCNFLCPKIPGQGATYLLDWQSPGYDLGSYDLVNLHVPFWTSEQRNENQREEKILHQYYETLQAHGVQNYSWEQLITDYKMGIIFWLLMPVQDCYNGSSKDYWWPKMQCLIEAYRDWYCEELLSGLPE
jgi:Ecdysteroid kinase-like family